MQTPSTFSSELEESTARARAADLGEQLDQEDVTEHLEQRVATRVLEAEPTGEVTDDGAPVYGPITEAYQRNVERTVRGGGALLSTIGAALDKEAGIAIVDVMTEESKAVADSIVEGMEGQAKFRHFFAIAGFVSLIVSRYVELKRAKAAQPKPKPTEDQRIDPTAADASNPLQAGN